MVLFNSMKSLSWLANLSRRPSFWPTVVVLIFGFLAARHLFAPGYFNMHDDLQMMRQLEMEKCFMDGQIPCRWVPDMGYGYGYPLFNYYPPLPYLTGQLFRVLGFSFVATAKLLFAFAFIASGLTMYALAKEFFGRVGGTLSAIFYIWAPYHSVDVYVRGAMNESWALIWFPLVFLYAYKVLASKETFKKNINLIILLALSWFALFTSHNLMVIVLLPFFALWCLLWLVLKRRVWAVPQLALGGALSIALAAFFTLPVILEKDIVQTGSLIVGYYEYSAHYASIAQILFSRFWGYGPSVWLTEDRMSFQIGWFHWIVPLFVTLYAVRSYIVNKTLSKAVLAVLFFVLSGWLAAFMIHSRSIFFWKHIEALSFIQFPWRYLTVVIFSFSFAAGGLMYFLKGKTRLLSAVFVVLAVLIYSWSFFYPEHGKMGKLTDEEKFTGAAWDLQQTAGIYDYLPNTAKTAPKAPRTVQAEFMEGKGKVIEGARGTNWEKFQIEAESDSVIRMNVMNYPNWVVLVNGQKVETYVADTEEWGRIYFNVPSGTSYIEARLYDTPVRTIGNMVSLLSWSALLAFLVLRRNGLILKSK